MQDFIGSKHFLTEKCDTIIKDLFWLKIRSIEELTLSEQWQVFEKAKRYISKYGWYVDTETYRSFFMEKEAEDAACA